jgi:penicillin G amidase
MSLLRPRLSALLSVLSVLLALAVAAAGWFWWQMRGSLPQLDGSQALAGLAAPVRVVRDAQGVPTLSGASRLDVARAMGYLHAQDRFFQMDLQRRRAAGELAELFGPAALELDKSARLHGFRRTARAALTLLPAADQAVLEAYSAGVNAGLAALARKPWEYLVLRTEPVAWRPEDSFLCVYAMWFDLQDSTGAHERKLRALQQAFGTEAMEFLAPVGDSHDAALDGSVTPAAPLPPLLRLKRPEPGTATLWDNGADLLPGSNNFAVDGAHTATGVGLLANDMHLGLGVPHIWYRAVLEWSDAAGPHRVAGVTLPGVPAVVAGSNGHIAWGFTNSYIDTTDVVILETDSIAQNQYLTSHGYVYLDERTEPIAVKGQAPVSFTARWSEWGPVIAGPEKGRYLALAWTAHHPEATNYNLQHFETVTTVDEAIALAHRTGMPNQNLLVADTSGRIGWTVTGLVPRRVGFDGRQPVSWAYGDRHWDGWLSADEVPAVTAPADGVLWTANNRVVGGAALAKVGEGGYDDGLRAGAIRDDLLTLARSGRKAAPADLLAIQLDDRGRYLDRWQKLLLSVLDDAAVAKQPARGALRTLARGWQGHASIDSAGYRILRAFRIHVQERTLAPFREAAEDEYAGFNFNALPIEDVVWRLVEEKPARLLNPANASWESLLLAAADDVTADIKQAGVSPEQFTWGARNTLAMQHPFSRFLPHFLGAFLDMPAQPLPGDSKMPRVQGPRFGASERMVVSPGREAEGIFEMPGGQSGHPLSPFYRAGHQAWVRGEPAPFLPGPAAHTLLLQP